VAPSRSAWTPRKGGFDPTTARWDEGGFLYGRTVFDPLAIVTATGKVEPYLAQSITSNPDYTVFTITLRSGINFHDGTPLNAAALQLNLQKQQASILTGPAFQNIASTQVTGPLTVTITTKTPWEELPYYLAEAQTGYIAAHRPCSTAPADDDTAGGHGALRVLRMDTQQPLHRDANPHYWRPGLPYLDSITFKPIIDPSSRVDALESGTIDIMHTNTPQTFGSFRHNTKWSYVDDSGAILGQPAVNCVMLNTAAAPFNNLKLRTAMAMASNPTQYAKDHRPRHQRADDRPLPPRQPVLHQDRLPGAQPEGGGQAGQGDREGDRSAGFFTLTATNNPETVRAGRPIPPAGVGQGRHEGHHQHSGAGCAHQRRAGREVPGRHLAPVRGRGPRPQLRVVEHHDGIRPIPLNMARNSDPRIQAALVLGRTTTDAATRIKAYQEVNQYLGEDIPYIYGDRSTWAIAANPNVQNFNNPKTRAAPRPSPSTPASSGRRRSGCPSPLAQRISTSSR
jgi:peptide/nickel transport system substrate-binding protein